MLPEHQSKWQLQQAKQCFSEVVRRAEKEGPQQITKGGVESVWVISAKDYHYLTENRENIVDFFQNSPMKGANIKLERRKDLPRDINL